MSEVSRSLHVEPSMPKLWNCLPHHSGARLYLSFEALSSGSNFVYSSLRIRHVLALETGQRTLRDSRSWSSKRVQWLVGNSALNSMSQYLIIDWSPIHTDRPTDRPSGSCDVITHRRHVSCENTGRLPRRSVPVMASQTKETQAQSAC